MRDLDREAVCEAKNSMAGSVRGVEERAWVRDGERRSKRSGEQLPAVQSGKKAGKMAGEGTSPQRETLGRRDLGGAAAV